MYREYVTVGHCEYFINTAGINVSIVYHLVLPEKKMRRSRLLEEIRIDCVQPQWDMRSELRNLNKRLKSSFTDTEYIKKSINPPKKERCTICPWCYAIPLNDEAGNVIEEVVELESQINLEMNSYDVQELLDSYNQEMRIHERIEMHEKDTEELQSLNPV
ncbi:hypothetical protein TNCV_2260991 [Trichonephila clavipes]|nr:hypothetical protein TNCV_2260991 [Trichonephila clavipes]